MAALYYCMCITVEGQERIFELGGGGGGTKWIIGNPLARKQHIQGEGKPLALKETLEEIIHVRVLLTVGDDSTNRVSFEVKLYVHVLALKDTQLNITNMKLIEKEQKKKKHTG